MDEIQLLLRSLLHDGFHIVSVHTQRQDQWYKRQYHSWKEQNHGHDLLILSPCQSKNEWAPRLSQLATYFAAGIHELAANKRDFEENSNLPSATKLFEDHVLDDNFALEISRQHERKVLSPAMQRLSFWTEAFKHRSNGSEPCTLAIQELLKRGQIQSLLYLARHPQTRGDILACSAGWRDIVVDMLELYTFMLIASSFPESLKVDGWNCWLPTIYCRDSSLIPSYLRDSGNDGVLIDEQQVCRDMERCITTLSMTEILWTECNLPALDWEKYVIDAFLSFTGFETWNRMRNGSRYLGCTLNTIRDNIWLHKNISENERLQMVEEYKSKCDDRIHSTKRKGGHPVTQTSRRTHNLVQIGINENTATCSDEEEDEVLEQLGILETNEAAYGLKRSMKYQRKVPTGIAREKKG